MARDFYWTALNREERWMKYACYQSGFYEELVLDRLVSYREAYGAFVLKLEYAVWIREGDEITFLDRVSPCVEIAGIEFPVVVERRSSW